MRTDMLAGRTFGAARRAKSRSRILPLDYARRRSLQVLLAAIFIFLYFPIVALVDQAHDLAEQPPIDRLVRLLPAVGQQARANR